MHLGRCPSRNRVLRNGLLAGNIPIMVAGPSPMAVKTVWDVGGYDDGVVCAYLVGLVTVADAQRAAEATISSSSSWVCSGAPVPTPTSLIAASVEVVPSPS